MIKCYHNEISSGDKFILNGTRFSFRTENPYLTWYKVKFWNSQYINILITKNYSFYLSSVSSSLPFFISLFWTVWFGSLRILDQNRRTFIQKCECVHPKLSTSVFLFVPFEMVSSAFVIYSYTSVIWPKSRIDFLKENENTQCANSLMYSMAALIPLYRSVERGTTLFDPKRFPSV